MTEEKIDRKNGWGQFHDKVVLIQLKGEYVGVDATKMWPATQKDEKGEDILGPDGRPLIARTNFMTGTLYVEKDEAGIVLKLGKAMRKTENDGTLMLLVAINPEAIAFCTMYHERPIVTE